MIALIKTLEKDILICNVYGPNKDNIKFFSQLEECVRQLGIDNIGDWKVVLNFQLDCHNYKHNNNTRGQKEIDKMTNLNLVDIWCELNPDLDTSKYYDTLGIGKGPFNNEDWITFLCRIHFQNLFVDMDIPPGYRTDHSLITRSIIKQQIRKKEI